MPILIDVQTDTNLPPTQKHIISKNKKTGKATAVEEKYWGLTQPHHPGEEAPPFCSDSATPLICFTRDDQEVRALKMLLCKQR